MNKTSYKIQLFSVDDVQKFVTEINEHISSDVDTSYQRYTVDAKSILAMLSICKYPVDVVLHSDDTKETLCFSKICKEYEVKNNE